MTVLVVEDDEDVRTVFTLTLRDAGFVVTEAGTCEEGLAAIARERPVPVYFIGVGEKLEDLQTFNAREFANALLS